MMKHIPNILSFFRIVSLPFFIWQIYLNHTFAAACILLISGITDLLDGALARKFGWITQLGKVLDPVADKLTQVTTCVLFLWKLHSYWIFFAILLTKDLIMLVIGSCLFKNGIKLEGAKWFGKVSTATFYITMILLLFIPDTPAAIVFTLLSITTGCALFSISMYIPEFLKYKSKAKRI